MIVDSSALAGILIEEPGRDILFEFVAQTDSVSLSAANFVEICMVIDSRREVPLSERIEALLRDLRVVVVPLTPEQARLARQAFRKYGRGFHARAKLNFGDCFAYALAKEAGEPLLFVSNDFVHTDITPALDPPILS